jgi:hypothetical protein
MSQITRSFKHGRDNDLAQIAHRITVSLTENPNFPNPPVPVATLEQALVDYQLALSNAAGRDKALIAIKNDKRAALRRLLSEMADYVSAVSNGDKTKLLQSGFTLSQARGELSLQPISLLEVETGPVGEAITRVKKVIGARTYIHEYTADPMMAEKSWNSRMTSEREVTFNDLPSGVKHWFRVRVVGMKGQMEQSPVVSRYIQ